MNREESRKYEALFYPNRANYDKYLESLLPDPACNDIEGYLRKELFGLDKKEFDRTIDPTNPKGSEFFNKLKKVVIDAYLDGEISVGRGGEVLNMSPYAFRDMAYKSRFCENIDPIDMDDLVYLTVKWMWSAPLYEYRLYCPFHKQGIERKIYTVLYSKSQPAFYTNGEKRSYVNEKQLADCLNCSTLDINFGLEGLFACNLILRNIRNNEGIYFVLYPVKMIRDIYEKK